MVTNYLIFLWSDSSHPYPHAHVFSLENNTRRTESSHHILDYPPCPPTGSCSRVTLPGRPSVRPRCWRATGPGHERPRSRSRRRTPGRRDWRTPAPATSQCGPLPSSVGNWVRMVRRVIIACGLRHHRSAFSQLEFSRQKSENAGKVNTTSTGSVCTHFPHQKLLRFRPFWSIFVNTESTSM